MNGVTGTAELPLLGFDSANNPLYNWNDAIIISPDTSLDVRYDPNNNRLFMLTSVPERVAVFNYAGTAVEEYDVTTGRRSVHRRSEYARRLRRRRYDWRHGDGTLGQLFLYRSQLHGRSVSMSDMFTWDGLLVASAMPGNVVGYTAGWLDAPNTSLAAVTYNGTYYCYTEDNAYGRLVRYAFSSTGENFVTRSNGNFAWTAPPPANALSPRTTIAWAGNIPRCRLFPRRTSPRTSSLPGGSSMRTAAPSPRIPPATAGMSAWRNHLESHRRAPGRRAVLQRQQFHRGVAGFSAG